MPSVSKWRRWNLLGHSDLVRTRAAKHGSVDSKTLAHLLADFLVEVELVARVEPTVAEPTCLDHVPHYSGKLLNETELCIDPCAFAEQPTSLQVDPQIGNPSAGEKAGAIA